MRAAVGAVPLVTALAIPGSAAAAARSSTPGSQPKWATPARDRGDVPGDEQVTVTVYMPLRDPARAEAFVRPVSDPRSARYGSYLSPEQFTTRVAATDDGAIDNDHVNATGTIDEAEARSPSTSISSPTVASWLTRRRR